MALPAGGTLAPMDLPMPSRMFDALGFPALCGVAQTIRRRPTGELLLARLYRQPDGQPHVRAVVLGQGPQPRPPLCLDPEQAAMQFPELDWSRSVL